MRKALLTRTEQSDQGTFGVILTDSGFTCRTGELPWRENAPDRSRIPAGKYLCTWRNSPKHGWCYHIENIAGRRGVEIHSANFMGDAAKGFRCELLGCIAPGMALGIINGQLAVTSSRKALEKLEEDLGQDPFELTIEDLPREAADTRSRT